MRWPNCPRCRGIGDGCMYCPDARDEELAQLCRTAGRSFGGNSGGPQMVIGMGVEEYESRIATRRERERRRALAELDRLLNPDIGSESEDLIHARRMLEQWEKHASSPTATLHAIEQRGVWERRVNELTLGPTAEPVPRRKKKRRSK